jgi:peptidyl-prolyl cis-trans isomerase SurA
MKRSSLCLVVLATVVLAACKRGAPPGVVAVVNGQAITEAELAKVYQTQYPQPPEGSNEDMVGTQRLDLLGSLITHEILLQRAAKMGLAAVDADVDTEINKLKAPYTKDEWDKQLAERKIGESDLRRQIQGQLTVDKLISKEIISHIAITDADVTNFYNANKPSFNLAEPQIHLAQILVTPVPDPEVRNLKNSKAQTPAEARNKINDLMARLKRGDDFAMVAQNYSEDTKTAANGGDMGYVPESAMDKADPNLRKLITSLQPGAVSQVIQTPEGFRILKVISKEDAGQRDLSDPQVQTKIRETLKNSKEELLREAYYEVARNNAKVINYMAQQIVDSAGKK